MRDSALTRFVASFSWLAVLIVTGMALGGCHLIFPYEKQDGDAAVDAPWRVDRRGLPDRPALSGPEGSIIDAPADSPSADRGVTDAAKPDTWPDGTGPDKGGCTIGGTYIPANGLNPSNACQRCDPSKSTSGWTSLQKYVVTLAGTGSPGLTNGPAASATFNAPRDIALTASGTLYVTDGNNAVIREISSGIVNTYAGTGIAGFLEGPISMAQFHDPHGIVLVGASASSQELYVADSANCRIRRITMGYVSTFAGTKTCGYKDDVASAAGFVYPRAIAAASGSSGKTVFYVADDTGNRIRKVVWESSNGNYVVSTLAGDGTAGYQDGTSAWFKCPKSLAVEQGSTYATLYVADGGNNVIRKITDGVPANTVTFAGDLTGKAGYADGGATSQALFSYPHGLVIESSKVMYVADASNYRIRKIAYDGSA